MRRRTPRPIGSALDRLLASLEPGTLLAEVQRAWPAAVGAVFAGASRPVGEKDGTVRVDCVSSVYAQELSLMADRVVASLNDHLGRPAVRGLRCGVRSGER